MKKMCLDLLKMTSKIVVNGACLACAAGSATTKLKVEAKLIIDAQSVATTLDGSPDKVGSFGYCSLTGAPCMPMTQFWISDGPKLNDFTILNQRSTLQCAVGGQIVVINPGQSTVET